MNMRHLTYIVMSIILIFALSGCETVPKKFKEDVSGIKTRVETLETRVDTVESNQAQTARSSTEQAQAIEELKSAKERPVKTNVGTKSRKGRPKENIKEIQISLKNAGFYSGQIDGVKGKNTKKATKEFQAANGLAPDGIVGRKTWGLLSKYAEAPQAASDTAEGAK